MYRRGAYVSPYGSVCSLTAAEATSCKHRIHNSTPRTWQACDTCSFRASIQIVDDRTTIHAARDKISSQQINIKCDSLIRVTCPAELTQWYSTASNIPTLNFITATSACKAATRTSGSNLQPLHEQTGSETQDIHSRAARKCCTPSHRAATRTGVT